MNHLFECQTVLSYILGATTPGQSGPGSNGNETVPHIPQSSKTRALPSVSYLEHSLRKWGEFYPSAEMQSVYSTAPVNWAEGSFYVCVLI